MKNLCLALIALAVTSCATQAPLQQGLLPTTTQGYYAASRSLESTEGNLEINNSEAVFSHRTGILKLTYSGDTKAPAPDGWFAAGTTVSLYRIENGSSFLTANRGGNGVDSRPLTWLAVARKDAHDLSLCLGVAEMDLNPAKPNTAACGIYARDGRYHTPVHKRTHQ